MRKSKWKRVAFYLCLLVFVLSTSGGGWLCYQSMQAEADFAGLAQYAHQTQVRQSTVQVTSAPDAETNAKLAGYQAIADKNSDFVGWLWVEGTRIDYPIMWSPETPQKYLRTNFEGEYSYSGVPFMAADCTVSPPSDVLIFYGHNMINGTMFRDLMQFEEESFYKTHRTIHFDTIEALGEYEIVAAFRTQVYPKDAPEFQYYQHIHFVDEADFLAWKENINQLAIYDTKAEFAYGDQFIALSTCCYHVENGRFVVLARKIKSPAI